MGVSISMRPGSIMRSLGKERSITPGWRSQAAKVLREYFGDFPMEIHAEDLETLRRMESAASVYTRDEENIWKIIADEIKDHSVVTLNAEY